MVRQNEENDFVSLFRLTKELLEEELEEEEEKLEEEKIINVGTKKMKSDDLYHSKAL